MIRLRGRRDPLVRGSSAPLQLALLGAGAAALVAYLLASGQTVVAAAASLLPIVGWVLAQPVVLLVPLGAVLPDTRSLTGGRGGFHVSISDIVLVLVGAGILIESTLARPLPVVRVLRPVLLPVLQYGAVMALLLVFHLGGGEVAQTAQRFELFLLPLIIGAYAALKGQHIRLLQAYVVASTALAIVWPLYDFGMQKNPVGQMIANAILLLVAVQRLRGLLPCLLILVPGLLLTQSRGR